MRRPVLPDGRIPRPLFRCLDPKNGGKVFERLSKHDVFGRMSFTTGLPRATEAHTSRDTRLLIIPREAFLGLLADSADLRSLAAERVRDKEVVTFLKHRHGLSDDHVSEWQDCGP